MRATSIEFDYPKWCSIIDISSNHEIQEEEHQRCEVGSSVL